MLKTSIGRILRDTAEVIIAAALVLVIARSVATTYTVNGPSMEPTLWQGERVFVNSFANLQLGGFSLYGQDGFIFSGPQRGDVVVFKPQENGPDHVVKRVIGVPGDQIDIDRQGRLFINGSRSDPDFISGIITSPKTYFSQYPIIVPEGHYFVLGDNRGKSNDSRNWGFVPAEDMAGKVWMVYWPFSDLTTF